jgi:hypothetical protein
MRRTALLVVAGIVLAALAIFVLCFGPSRITRDNYNRIEEGMSRAEVEQILGGPPGDYRTHRTMHDENDPNTSCLGDVDALALGVHGYLDDLDGPPTIVGKWFGNEGHILIYFSPETVEAKYWWCTVNYEQSTLNNVLWHAKRQWRKWFP